ncbi:unnamed protein product [Pieris brassicae]|uniref:Uncharacterized protein n=1 Tax=Pieris brassicae TaxID=7116 RepID=A0A9P0SVM6_PIEBR|nr:unnamed protein product [Pieris brassicae]
MENFLLHVVDFVSPTPRLPSQVRTLQSSESSSGVMEMEHTLTNSTTALHQWRQTRRDGGPQQPLEERGAPVGAAA